MVCTFFGHRDAPESAGQGLYDEVLHLIRFENVKEFYVGCQGGFDQMVIRVLKRLRMHHPHIRCTVVLAYMPLQPDVWEGIETLLPEGFECVPRRFAIDRRNRWMIDHSKYVVTYVTRTVGGAAKYKQLAEQKGKTIIELAK